MIEQSQTLYYITYALLCGAVGVAYLKFKSTEGAVITTKEFQVFQSGFLTGYSLMMLCEVIAAASFYHTLLSVHLDLTQITKLYAATIISTTLTSVGTEIVDLGSRRDKCVLSAALYCASMFSLLFGGHFEMLLLGRLVYGAAASLHHSCFEAYAVHAHATLGFPEDWLGRTFTLLTHCMALVAAVAGPLGQVASSTGGPHFGSPALCCTLFAAAAVYIALTWERDLAAPRFTLSAFLSNMSNTAATLRSNRQMLLLVVVSSLCEAAILIFSFYWAPWFDLIADEEEGEGEGQHIPYEMVFASFILSSMLGNYLFQMYAKNSNNNNSNGSSSGFGGGVEGTFQALLIGMSAAFLLGAIFQTPSLALLVSIFVQLCIGGYWPSIGYFRGRLLLPEQRNTVLIISR